MSAFAAFFTESRMRLIDSTKPNRKSGYLTTLLWADVGSSRKLTLIPLRSIEFPRVAGREQ